MRALEAALQLVEHGPIGLSKLTQEHRTVVV